MTGDTMTQEQQDALTERINFLSSRILEMEEKAMTQEQQAPKKRVRINRTISVKGIVTWDVTVELTGDLTSPDSYELDKWTLAESDWLVKQLETRHPTPAVE